MLDYNWLYSAVAQSCAAIVGVFGAFLLTKVISAQSAFAARTQMLRELEHETQHMVDRAHDCAFAWYNQRMLEDGLAGIRLAWRRSSEEDRSAEEYYEDGHFSPFQPRAEVIGRIEACLKDMKGRRFVSAPDMASYVPSIGEAVQQEREKINRLEIEIRHHARRLEAFLAECGRAPESSMLVTLSCFLSILLFFTGVVWPLSFLPVHQGEEVRLSLGAIVPTVFSLKGVILTTISTTFVAIVATFLIANIRMRISADRMRPLAEYTEVTRYSEFFRVQADNSMDKG